ncbi:MAG TPA: glycine betaine ABC transporter substrate-binding protein [Dongiaceae bacterium]|nr:glycine betaine ABC transporter substrate-binding protein [Dongiaceae bacterium]
MTEYLNTISRRRILAGMGAAAAVAALPLKARAASAVKVGWTTDTEQSILGNITALILEKKLGIAVERVSNLGGTGIAHQSIISGAIDIYPDYTGDALANVLKLDPLTDPAKAWQAVHDGYAKDYKITWLKPTPFNNTYALALKEVTAAKLNITTISGLASQAPNWKLGCSVEFAGRPLDGYPGMSKHYGFKFGSVKPMDVGLMYTAVDSGSVDVIVAFATDARIGKVGLRVLQDDKLFFPSYNAAITVRDDILAAHPDIAAAIEAVTSTLKTEVQIKLNGRADIDGVAPETVAEDYLKELKVL